MNKQRRGDLARATLNYDSDPNNRAPASHILAISHPIWIIIWNWEFIGDSKRFSHNSAMGPKLNDQELSGSIESVEVKKWPIKIQNWPQNLRTRLKSGATCSCLGSGDCALVLNIKDCDETMARHWMKVRLTARLKGNMIVTLDSANADLLFQRLPTGS